jgi:threonine/homoserine/homoserine lactone efflux protein
VDDPFLFTLTVLAILGTPGPTNTLLATAGATAGFRRASPLLAAEASGYLISILTIGYLLGPVVAAYPAVGLALRLLVGAYLFYLALRLWRYGRVAEVAGRNAVTFRQVFVTTLLNPKALVFALGVIPLGAPQLWAYFTGFVGMLLCVGSAWIAFGSGAGIAAHAAGRTYLVPRVGALAVACFAAVLLVQPFL